MIFGLTTDQLAELAAAVGPWVASVVGLLLTGVVSVVGWAGRLAWKTHVRRMAQMAKAVETLAKAADEKQKSDESENRRVWDALTQLKTEVALDRRAHEGLGRAVFNLEGVAKTQGAELKEATGQLRDVAGQLKAVFRFIDASHRRATDVDEDDGGANGSGSAHKG